ncbi:ATP-binding protein [Desulfonema magnum]|uniref:histidine kinase n=1 Tax=Desulfonema magnum TaxID=45655 RepID=A0A975BNY1_9BACT|nr:ATP-binding protein [Desulfonema magnum]QTA88996.1 Two component system response regulator/histidine kinase, PAS domain-containing [Desulfonema magnum]
MRTDTEKEYLLKAIDAFKRKIVVVSPEFKILATNHHIIEMYGENLVGQVCYQVMHGRASPCKHCPASKVIQTRKPTLMESEIISLDSDAVCIYSYPIISEKEVDAVVMLDFDLPVLEELEERLQRSNSFLRNLILSSVDGVIAADKTGKIFIFNEAAAEISGYSVTEALGHLDIRDVYPGDGAREVMRKLRSEEYGGKGKLKSYQLDVITNNGETIPISLNAAIIYEGGKEVASIGFFHDLRETLRMKAELEKAQLQLLQSEKMASLGKLAAGVAHQLNNPLGGITLFTKLMLEEYELENDAREDLNRILKDAQRCRDTVRELLEFARQTQYNIRPNDINKAISRTLFLLENQAIFQNIEIRKNLAPCLPPVPTDIQQMNHVFMNIILNAAEAMEGQGILTVTTVEIPEKNRISIEISDTAPGIPEDILPHIFEPFFTTKEEGKGTGLGLSLVYSIVENHGGNITAKSDVSQGTTFIIELPLSNSETENGD